MVRWIAALYFRRREAGMENIPAEGPFILASNHASFMDPPLVGASCGRPISYLARESLFRNPLFGRVLRAVGCVPVDRDGASGKGLKTIFERLLRGDGIILFPEGTRSTDGELQHGRPGIGLVVLKSTVPVVPVRVFGTFAAYGRSQRLPLPRQVGLRFGPPLDFAEPRAEAATAARPRLKELYQEVADEIMAAITRIPPP
jgi:1-acyl-sn-glycerol-3-phosphate acyltransferase